MTAEDFYQQAYDLGYPPAAVNLSLLYTKEQACMMKYLEEGVKRGNAQCMTNLGVYTSQSGNHEDAKRHLMTAARSGRDNAMPKMISRQPFVLTRLLVIKERVNLESMQCVTKFLKKREGIAVSYPNMDDAHNRYELIVLVLLCHSFVR